MDDLKALIAEGRHDEAAQGLFERIARRERERGGHADEARLAEALGQSTMALRAWQLVVRDDPADVEGWKALAQLHDERGDSVRAQACRERLDELGSAQPALRLIETLAPAGVEASTADLLRFLARFSGREDVWARMWFDPEKGVGYSPVRQPMTVEDVAAHVEGRITAGIYLLRSDDTAQVAVLDLDITKRALEAAQGDRGRTLALKEALVREAFRIHQALKTLGADALWVDSGYKGRHWWFQLPGATPADQVHPQIRELARALSPVDPRFHLEAFPKQRANKEGGIGNLVKLPLGVHLRTRRRALLLDDRGEPLLDPFGRLRDWRPGPIPSLSPPPEPTATALVPVAPPVQAPRWTEADYDVHPNVAKVLSGCGVLRDVVRSGLEDKALSRDAGLVLNHSLGHLPDGPQAVNFVYDRIADFPTAERLQSPLRGSPVSCAKIRARLPEVAARMGCACKFGPEPGQYDHPLRHLDGVVLGTPRPHRTLDELLATWQRQKERLAAVMAEEEALRGAVVEGLRRVPGGRWPGPGGSWVLSWEADLPVLLWEEGP